MSHISVLGQTYHYHSHAATGSVTSTDVMNEFHSRGYALQRHIPPPVEERPITKDFAIKVAVDYAIEGYRLPNNGVHFYRCPSGSGCQIPESTWNSMITWTTTAANAYLQGAPLPSWAATMWHSGAYLHGFAFAGVQLSGWLQDNPWFVTAIANVLETYGAYLTSKKVQETIEQNAPKGVLTKDDIPALIAALQAQGAVQPGQEAALEKGAQAAVTPSWIWPVAIGGGILAVLMLMKK